MTSQYAESVRQLATNDPVKMCNLLDLLSRKERYETRVFYTNSNTAGREGIDRSTATELINRVRNDEKQGFRAVCVIENISPAFIEELGTTWQIDPLFFANHATNPTKDRLWDRIEWKHGDKIEHSLDPYQHLNGIFEYHESEISVPHMANISKNYCCRHVFKDYHWPVNSNIIISYCRPLPGLYLFLVDPPIDYYSAFSVGNDLQARIMLRFPYSTNRGGLLLPSLRPEKMCVPIEVLKNAFDHQWQIDLLFSGSGLFPGVPLLYMLTSSLWETNLRGLDADIRDISFNRIRKPNLKISDDLHDLRRELSTMKIAMTETQRFAPDPVAHFFNELREQNRNQKGNLNMRLTPMEIHDQLLERAGQLHIFFMETIQLLMNTIAIRDSQENLKQTRQSVLLTSLAAIYLPLSLATAVFGMNLSEMTGSGPAVWIFVVTLVPMVLVTVAILRSEALYNRFSDMFRQQASKPSKQR